VINNPDHIPEVKRGIARALASPGINLKTTINLIVARKGMASRKAFHGNEM
jgi:hypothetical protein